MIKIETKGLRYFSYLDEEHFFTWAQDIDCVESVDAGVLHINAEKVDEASLRDLLAILARYQLPMHQLKTLLTNENEGWFNNTSAYWYKGVFTHA